MDYKNGKIYKITSDNTDKIYVGSTCQPLYKRMGQHRGKYKQFLNGKRNNISSYELIKLGDAIITLIEDYPCERKEQLQARERYYIELNKEICVNKCIPTRTRKEYRQDNKDKIAENSKEYYQINKDKIAENSKEYYQINKEKIEKYQEEYYQINKDKIAENSKEYYQINKDKLIAMNLENYYNNKELRSNQMKEYNNKNRDSILDKKNQKVECVCGGRYTTANKAVHSKSIKHQSFINQQSS